MGVFNFWLLVAGAVLATFTLERLSGPRQLVLFLALAGFGLCLAVGQVLRASDWATAWSLQNKILAEAPIGELKHTEADARIILVNPREVNGVPVFAASWDINNAIAWSYPFLRQNAPLRLTALTLDEVLVNARKYSRRRQVIVYNPYEGPMKWDGSQLSYEGQAPLETAASLYLWRPSDMSFWRPSGPFVISPNLTIEPAK
jgi:hypothetical protein